MDPGIAPFSREPALRGWTRRSEGRPFGLHPEFDALYRQIVPAVGKAKPRGREPSRNGGRPRVRSLSGLRWFPLPGFRSIGPMAREFGPGTCQAAGSVWLNPAQAF